VKGERDMSLSKEELEKLRTEYQKLPEGKNYRTNDYFFNLFITVLDFQMKSAVVDSSLGFYKEYLWSEIRTHEALAELMSSYPNTKGGNMHLAKYLWNNNHWSRAKFLRELLKYFGERNVWGMKALSTWNWGHVYKLK
jgi:hypothetical protein